MRFESSDPDPKDSFKGKFVGMTWNISPPKSGDDYLNLLAAIHEWCHSAITNMTSVGGIILFYHTLSLAAKQGRERYHELWLNLVRLSRESHEVFATSYSVLIAKDHLPNLTIELPAEYLRFLQKCEAMLGGLKNPFLKTTALAAIFRICFESPALTAAARRYETFRISDVRAREYPDERLNRIQRSVPPGFFEAEFAAFLSSLTEGPLLDAIRRTESVSSGVDIFEEEGRKIADAAELATSAWLHEALTRLLLPTGMEVNQWARHMRLFETDLPVIESLCDSDLYPGYWFVGKVPSSAESALRLWENEVVSIRDKPLPAKLIYFSELNPDIWDEFDESLGISHLFVDVQFSRELLAHYRFSAEATAELTLLDGPVAFIHTVDPTDEDPLCSVFIFSTPQELEFFCEKCPVPVFGALPLSAFAHELWDESWNAAWSKLRAVNIIDGFLIDLLGETWKEIAFIRYERLDFDCPSGRLAMVVLEPDPEAWSDPQIVLGSVGLAVSLVSYIESLEDPRYQKDSLVIERNFESLSKAMTHMIYSRRYISRNGNQFTEPD